MYSLLVVDDERFAVQGITRGIDWTDTEITNIHEAYNTERALEILRDNPVDLLISDIEMPGLNGIQLIQRVREEYPHVKTIFLTAHANFDYAKDAIHLGSLDYILKPFDPDTLKHKILECIFIVKKEREWIEFSVTHKKYNELWQAQLPVMIERFWQDVFNERISLSSSKLEATLSLYHLQLDTASKMVTVLISVEQWKEPLSTRDEEIMEYALRNAAQELILKDLQGCVFQERSGVNLTVVYLDVWNEEIKRKLTENCCAFIEACMKYFFCELTCYIGNPSLFKQLMSDLKLLLDLERSYISDTGAVHFLDESPIVQDSFIFQPPFTEWSILLETGSEKELLQKVDQWLEQLPKKESSIETLESFYFGLLQMLFDIIHRKGFQIQHIIAPQQLLNISACTSSIIKLRHWTQRIVSQTISYIRLHQNSGSDTVNKIKQYIKEHLEEKLLREELAKGVYINPAYLSRLFKMETQLSLTDYILEVRMAKARKLLSETDDKVSDIAEQVGYHQFSHFSKIFRKTVGFSPQEFRQYYKKFKIYPN